MSNKIKIEQAYTLRARRHKNGTFSGGWVCILCGHSDISNHVGINEDEENHAVERSARAHVRGSHSADIEE